MDPNPAIVAAAVLGSLGAACAALLALAARFFHVEEEPRAQAIQDALPGANCGGCGYPGCAGYAAAVAAGKAEPTLCAPGGPATAARIGEVLGVAVTARARRVARLRCNGGGTRAVERVGYSGAKSCKALTLLVPGGTKKCPQACEGLGDCVGVCAFGAIEIGPEKLPVVDEQKCTGCGRCVEACPKFALAMQTHAEKLEVRCGNQVPTKEVRKVCEVGCLHCKACVRACPYDALVWKNDLPERVDGKCRSCGLCVEVCRPKVMHFAAGFQPIPEVREEAKRLAAGRKAAAAAARAQPQPEGAAATPQPGDSGDSGGKGE